MPSVVSSFLIPPYFFIKSSVLVPKPSESSVLVTSVSTPISTVSSFFSSCEEIRRIVLASIAVIFWFLSISPIIY